MKRLMKAKDGGAVIVLGSANIDVFFTCREFPRPGETLVCESVLRSPGGKGLNQAVAASRADAPTSLLGAVGDDAAGLELREFLIAELVDVSRMAVCADRPTGLAHILVDALGENMIVVAAGANQAGELARLSQCLPAASIAVAQLETPLEAVDAFLTAARARRMRTILNAAPAIPGASSLFEKCDFLVLNEHELGAFVGSRRDAVAESIVASARRIMADHEIIVVVTLGARGVLIVSRQDHDLVPAFPVSPIDTTGAGDCFCGYFAAAMGRGLAPSAAAREAATAAAISTTLPGAAGSIPRRDELLVGLASEAQD